MVWYQVIKYAASLEVLIDAGGEGTETHDAATPLGMCLRIHPKAEHTPREGASKMLFTCSSKPLGRVFRDSLDTL